MEPHPSHIIARKPTDISFLILIRPCFSPISKTSHLSPSFPDLSLPSAAAAIVPVFIDRNLAWEKAPPLPSLEKQSPGLGADAWDAWDAFRESEFRDGARWAVLPASSCNLAVLEIQGRDLTRGE